MTTVRDVELAWHRLEREGAKPGAPRADTMIWGHGLTSCRADEDRFGLVDFASLTTRFSVVRYDARGHGSSGSSTDLQRFRWDEMARDQLALADEVGIEHYVAAGASLGAATAIHAALLAPDRIRALVLVIPPTGWETRAAQTAMYDQMADIIEHRGVATLLNAPPMPPPDPLADNEAWAKNRNERLASADPVRLAGLFRGAAFADLPERVDITSIDAPTLILAWSGDPGHPVSTADELGELLPNASVHIASTADEFASWTPTILDFYQSL